MFKVFQEFGISSIVSAIAVLSLAVVVFLYRHAKIIQGYKLKTSKEQLDAIVDLYAVNKGENNDVKNKFVVEQVFHFKFKFYIQFAVIQILLGLDNPTEAIMNYKYGKLHLVLNKEKNEKYRNKWRRIDIIFYFINATIAVGIFFSANLIYENLGYIAMVTSFFYGFVFLWAAFESGSYAGRILAAEKLMKEFSRSL